MKGALTPIRLSAALFVATAALASLTRAPEERACRGLHGILRCVYESGLTYTVSTNGGGSGSGFPDATS